MKQTPAEQARELVKRFETAISEESMDSKGIINYSAKQCAIIACNELINSLMPMSSTDDTELDNSHSDYWEQVKTEIDNL